MSLPDLVDEEYPGLAFGRRELVEAMQEAYAEIIKFVVQPAFKAFYTELMSLDRTRRPSFVSSTLFNPDELSRRGISVPDGILIQLSAFGDRRPTLFAVKKMMPEKFQAVWENMNITFNNEFKDEDISSSDENAWRPPLPVAFQNLLLAKGEDLESVPTSAGIEFGIYAPPTSSTD